MQIQYSWLTENGLPMPRPNNPFRRTSEDGDLGMRLELPSGLDEEDRNRIAALLKLLTGRPTEDDGWLRALEGQRTFLVLARRRPNQNPATWPGTEIVGMATLILIDKLTGRHGQVEDVAVHEDAQGCGVARGLMRRLHVLAYDFECAALNLTSAPKRAAANALYRKLGYEIRETNCYRLML